MELVQSAEKWSKNWLGCEGENVFRLWRQTNGRIPMYLVFCKCVF